MTATLIVLSVLAIAYGAFKTWFHGTGRGVHEIDNHELPIALKKICDQETDPQLAHAQALYNEFIESKKTDALKARERLEKKAAQTRLREARKLVRAAEPKKTAKILKMPSEREK